MESRDNTAFADIVLSDDHIVAAIKSDVEIADRPKILDPQLRDSHPLNPFREQKQLERPKPTSGGPRLVEPELSRLRAPPAACRGSGCRAASSCRTGFRGRLPAP